MGAARLAALFAFFFALHAHAVTFVYVSNADDGEIGMYTLRPDGTLQPGQRFKAGPSLGPMSVSPDKRFIVAASRAKPFTAYSFSIDRATGALKPAGSGPRHLVVSPDNRFVFLLNELTGTVTTLALENGLLREVETVSSLPPESKLGPGMPRPQPNRDVSNDVWASDIHITPNGKFLYAAERTSSSIGALAVDTASGRLSYLGSTSTEKQPRGFAIGPAGRYMVVSGEKSDTSSYRIEPSGLLLHLGKYSTGKGSNWVEIVSFD